MKRSLTCRTPSWTPARWSQFLSHGPTGCAVAIARLLQEFHSQAEACSSQAAKEQFSLASALPAFHARTNPFELTDRKVNIWKLVLTKPRPLLLTNLWLLSKVVQTRAFPPLFRSRLYPALNKNHCGCPWVSCQSPFWFMWCGDHCDVSSGSDTSPDEKSLECDFSLLLGFSNLPQNLNFAISSLFTTTESVMHSALLFQVCKMQRCYVLRSLNGSKSANHALCGLEVQWWNNPNYHSWLAVLSAAKRCLNACLASEACYMLILLWRGFWRREDLVCSRYSKGRWDCFSDLIISVSRMGWCF